MASSAFATTLCIAIGFCFRPAIVPGQVASAQKGQSSTSSTQSFSIQVFCAVSSFTVIWGFLDTYRDCIPFTSETSTTAEATGRVSLFRYCRKAMAPKGAVMQTIQGPYGEQLIVPPGGRGNCRESDSGVKDHCPVVQFTVTLPTPINIRGSQSHLPFPIFVRTHTTKAYRPNVETNIARHRAAYCGTPLSLKVNALMVSTDSELGVTRSPVIVLRPPTFWVTSSTKSHRLGSNSVLPLVDFTSGANSYSDVTLVMMASPS